MNDEKHMPNEDWEMSASNVSAPAAEVTAVAEAEAGEWVMPEPVFRVSDGDTVKISGIETDGADSFDVDSAPPPAPMMAESETVVQAQPGISDDYKFSESGGQTFYASSASTKISSVASSEGGNAKWLVLLGGIFIFFAVLVGIMLGVYFLFWRE